jgi:hypothetical protein
VIPEPRTALDGGHHGADKGFALGKVGGSLLLKAADGFAVSGVIGH